MNALRNYLLEQLCFKEKTLIPVRETRFLEDEPIAIIGMSAVFPGAPDLKAFWQLLRDGLDGISEVPKSRWDVEAYYDPNPEAPGKSITRHGGFIEDIDRFDAAFFGISPKEALYIDPQQRLLLMHTWSALEHAGIAPKSLAGSDTGVFIGIGGREYNDLITHFSSTEAINAYFGTGTAASMASGRFLIRWVLKGRVLHLIRPALLR